MRRYRGPRQPSIVTRELEDRARGSLGASGFITRLEIEFPHVDTPALVDAVTDQWFSRRLCRMKGRVTRLHAELDECHWHTHDHDDEFLFVLQGEFVVEFLDRAASLTARRGIVVPKGTVHRTRPVIAQQRRSPQLMVLRASTSTVV